VKILKDIPRHAYHVFFWCAVFTAVVCLGSIAAFWVLMPDNEHGRRAIQTAHRAFGPGLLAGVGIAVTSFRALRAFRIRRTAVEG
jgi:hypothetical protein